MSLSLDEIYDLFIWDQSYSSEEYDERVREGIIEASKFKNLFPFLQPIVIPPEKSKSVWDSCAKILAVRSDEELEPYLYQLFEWLQDMNWPGADIIYERLSKFPYSKLEVTIQCCRNTAIKMNDHVWLCVLDGFQN